MNKIQTKHDFAKGSYITTQHYEELIKKGYRTFSNDSGLGSFNLYSPSGELVHSQIKCKDAYRIYLKTIPENLP